VVRGKCLRRSPVGGYDLLPDLGKPLLHGRVAQGIEDNAETWQHMDYGDGQLTTPQQSASLCTAVCM
jgi:hypothetical protein